MTDRDPRRPLEERPEVAAAVDDDTGVPELMTQGGPGRDNPAFAEPGEQSDRGGPTEDIIADPYAAGTGATGTGTGASTIRTGAEQPWDPEDLVMARGQDPTPENIDRARRDLTEIGQAAIEKTVP
ncbi:hypothetical protein GCM10011608_35720 [Micromonospora sonchi]|uniref:Uncharacterized protein n=1 Tax=Micromonospora sonchi TaxID=1763543 RepID=A0A917U130_9ACTN|nr:hypothetical protein [Micromonospora sonchi]GGM47778.1 hypothetical protein GCM10011608_35720 [Micromonospora sonchi]